MSLLKSLLFYHSWMYAKRGDVATFRVVCIGRSSSITQYKQHDMLPHHHS